MTMSQKAPLKRSQKTDFSGVVARERSFIRTNKEMQNKRKSQAIAVNKGGKPTMEIYRPPNVRSDGSPAGKLNVHAKEFTMNNNNGELQPSRSVWVEVQLVD